MAGNDTHGKEAELNEGEVAASNAENARRALMAKLAAGAFAVPAILMTLNKSAAALSPA